MKKRLYLRDDLMEETAHGDYAFPFEINHDTLSGFVHGLVDCHWHPEVEMTLVLEGHMEIQVNDVTWRLHAGEGMFANANALHTCRPVNGQDCRYLAFIFDPVLVSGHPQSLAETRYVLPLTLNPALPAVVLRPEVAWEGDVLALLSRVYQLWKQRQGAWELRIGAALCEVWAQLAEHAAGGVTETAPVKRETERLKAMLHLIHSRYDTRLTLSDIAAAGNVSRSECCRFFKRMLRQSPVEYLTHYRIRRSLALLRHPELSVTEVALSTGFSHASYFSEIFRKCMGCTPREYRGALS